MKLSGIENNDFVLRQKRHVEKIAKPLLRESIITHFCFVRLFAKGGCCILSMHPDWCRHFYHHGYNNLLSPDLLTPGLHLLKKESAYGAIKSDALDLFQIDYPSYISYVYQEYIDLFIFGTRPRNKQILDYYINHQQHLKNFCLYFYDIGKKKIIEGSRLEHRLQTPRFIKHMDKRGPANKHMSFILRHFSVPNITLSWRELQTCVLYIRGRSWNEIADLLHIQSETARDYYKKARVKMNVVSKSDFFDKAYHLNLHHITPTYILGLKNIKNIL